MPTTPPLTPQNESPESKVTLPSNTNDADSSTSSTTSTGASPNANNALVPYDPQQQRYNCIRMILNQCVNPLVITVIISMLLVNEQRYANELRENTELDLSGIASIDLCDAHAFGSTAEQLAESGAGTEIQLCAYPFAEEDKEFLTDFRSGEDSISQCVSDLQKLQESPNPDFTVIDQTIIELQQSAHRVLHKLLIPNNYPLFLESHMTPTAETSALSKNVLQSLAMVEKEAFIALEAAVTSIRSKKPRSVSGMFPSNNPESSLRDSIMKAFNELLPKQATKSNVAILQNQMSRRIDTLQITKKLKNILKLIVKILGDNKSTQNKFDVAMRMVKLVDYAVSAHQNGENDKLQAVLEHLNNALEPQLNAGPSMKI